MRIIFKFLAFVLGMSLIFYACAGNEVKEIDPSAPPPAGFVLIKGGTFVMGAPASEGERFDFEKYDEVQHSVTVSSFYMSKYQVTQKEYREVMGKNPSNFKGDNLPVDSVTWYDALEYCNKRSIKEGLTPVYTIKAGSIASDGAYISEEENITWNRKANGYRLPTEAEWEYACRAGTTTPFNTGNSITTKQANYDGSVYDDNGNVSYNNKRDKPTPVGSFAPNPWGLYDIHGNVDEWCWDWYGDYKTAAQKDPDGAVFSGTFKDGNGRVLRGGSWASSSGELRSAFRNYCASPPPSYKYDSWWYYKRCKGGGDYVGFRLVRR